MPIILMLILFSLAFIQRVRVSVVQGAGDVAGPPSPLPTMPRGVLPGEGFGYYRQSRGPNYTG